MNNIIKVFAISALVISLTGCAIDLPFNNRLGFSSVKEMKAVQVQGQTQPNINIIWNPITFPERIDVHGASGFVGGGSQTRVPTGVALSSRIEEAVSQYANLTPTGTPLTINVIEATSNFEYSAGIFNVTPAIDVGDVTLRASFVYGSKSWSGVYTSYKHDPKIGGSSATGTLEAAWDDVAVQVAKDIANHIR